MQEHFEVIARGVCIKSGKILLCQTKGSPITYLPGGHVDFMETARESLEREIMEELACASVAGKFLGMIEHSFIQKGQRHCEWNAFFELKISDLNPDEDVSAAEEHLQFKWCELDELESAKLEPAVLLDLLPQWLASPQRETACWTSAGDFVR